MSRPRLTTDCLKCSSVFSVLDITSYSSWSSRTSRCASASLRFHFSSRPSCRKLRLGPPPLEALLQRTALDAQRARGPRDHLPARTWSRDKTRTQSHTGRLVFEDMALVTTDGQTKAEEFDHDDLDGMGRASLRCDTLLGVATPPPPPPSPTPLSSCPPSAHRIASIVSPRLLDLPICYCYSSVIMLSHLVSHRMYLSPHPASIQLVSSRRISLRITHHALLLPPCHIPYLSQQRSTATATAHLTTAPVIDSACWGHLPRAQCSELRDRGAEVLLGCTRALHWAERDRYSEPRTEGGVRDETDEPSPPALATRQLCHVRDTPIVSGIPPVPVHAGILLDIRALPGRLSVVQEDE
ncbi:hypothetical protein K438DRAFT_1960961 [Mycena galopus ATCC 62051]|nr:hypothetical protein K438DRAFT_1960961 [Mycena galopus ATCC 62051]